MLGITYWQSTCLSATPQQSLRLRISSWLGPGFPLRHPALAWPENWNHVRKIPPWGWLIPFSSPEHPLSSFGSQPTCPKPWENPCPPAHTFPSCGMTGLPGSLADSRCIFDSQHFLAVLAVLTWSQAENWETTTEWPAQLFGLNFGAVGFLPEARHPITHVQNLDWTNWEVKVLSTTN